MAAGSLGKGVLVAGEKFGERSLGGGKEVWGKESWWQKRSEKLKIEL